jgi:anti-sigma factor RsiW
MKHLSTEELAEFLDNELDADKRSRVANHLSQCSECDSKIKELENIQQLFSSVQPLAHSSQFSKRVMEEVAKQIAPKHVAVSRVTTGKLIVPSKFKNIFSGWSLENLLQASSFAVAVTLLIFVPEPKTSNVVDMDTVLFSNFDDEVSSVIFSDEVSAIDLVGLANSEEK